MAAPNVTITTLYATMSPSDPSTFLSGTGTLSVTCQNNSSEIRILEIGLKTLNKVRLYTNTTSSRTVSWYAPGTLTYSSTSVSKTNNEYYEVSFSHAHGTPVGFKMTSNEVITKLICYYEDGSEEDSSTPPEPTPTPQPVPPGSGVINASMSTAGNPTLVSGTIQDFLSCIGTVTYMRTGNNDYFNFKENGDKVISSIKFYTTMSSATREVGYTSGSLQTTWVSRNEEGYYEFPSTISRTSGTNISFTRGSSRYGEPFPVAETISRVVVEYKDGTIEDTYIKPAPTPGVKNIFLGGYNIPSIYLGADSVDKIYLGSELIFKN